MNNYFDGAIGQLIERSEHLLTRIQPALSAEYHALEQNCRKKLIETMDGLRALLEDPQMRKPNNQRVRIRSYRRLVEDLDLVESVVIPTLSRAQKPDEFLNRLVHQIRNEIKYPLLPPVVSPFSQNYFYIEENFNLIFVHPVEGNFLLHLPDLYHELAHPLVWERGYPNIKAFQISLIEALDEVKSWLRDELNQKERGRGPDSYKLYLRQWIKSWEDWCIEFYCDLFATFTLGPAYAWSHLHLCAARGSDPYEIPLISTSTHPADDARMRAILDGLCLIGFAQEAADIENRWEELVATIGCSCEPEYTWCFPDHIIDLLVDKAYRGVTAMRCRIAGPNIDDPVHSTLNLAWQEFWRSPSRFVYKERELIATLQVRSEYAWKTV